MIAIPQTPPILLPRLEFPAWIRNLKDDAVSKMFGSPMGDGAFVQPMGGVSGVVAVPWYLSGGIAAANCKIAYRAKGAASYATSKVNLVNAGTNDATDGATPPSWASASGWTFTGNVSASLLTTGLTVSTGWTFIVRGTVGGSGGGADGRILATDNLAMKIVPRTAASNRNYQYGGANSPTGYITPFVMALAGGNCYINGSADGTLTPSGASSPLNIGNIPAGTRGLDGTVQAVAVYNVILSAGQVAALTTAMQAL